MKPCRKCSVYIFHCKSLCLRYKQDRILFQIFQVKFICIHVVFREKTREPMKNCIKLFLFYSQSLQVSYLSGAENFNRLR